MESLRIDVEDVEKVLLKLKPNKSPGPDAFHPMFLRNTAKVMSKPLKIIFCKSLETGDLPKDWKTANISAIYKNKGSKKMPNNYRPISLTCVICKIMETIIRNHIMDYMKANRLFSKKQFGFFAREIFNASVASGAGHLDESFRRRV